MLSSLESVCTFIAYRGFESHPVRCYCCPYLFLHGHGRSASGPLRTHLQNRTSIQISDGRSAGRISRTTAPIGNGLIAINSAVPKSFVVTGGTKIVCVTENACAERGATE